MLRKWRWVELVLRMDHASLHDGTSMAEEGDSEQHGELWSKKGQISDGDRWDKQGSSHRTEQDYPAMLQRRKVKVKMKAVPVARSTAAADKQ